MKKNSHKKLHKGMLIFYIACGIVLLLVFSLMIFRMVLTSKLNTKLDEIRAAGYPATLAELNDYYPAVPDDENAAILYGKAFSLYCDIDDKRFKQNSKKQVKAKREYGQMSRQLNELVVFAGFAPDPVLGERLNRATQIASQQFVDANRKCIAMLKQASKLPKCRFNIDLTKGALVEFSHLSQLRYSIELLALATVLAAENDDKKQVMDNIMTMLSICHALNNEPIIYSYLVNINLQSITINIIEYAINMIEFDEQSLQKISRELRSFLNNSDKIQEKVLAADQIMIIDFESLTGACEYENILNYPYAIAKFTGITTLNKIKLFEMSQELFTLNKNDITAIKQYELKKKLQLDKLASSYFLTKQIMYDPNAIIHEKIMIKAKLKGAIIVLAIERYRLKYHKLPEKLTQLAPEFIKELPNDPFTQQPFRYVVGKLELIIDKKYKNGYSDSYKHEKMCYMNGGRITCIKRQGWMVYSYGQDLDDDNGISVGIKDYNNGDIPFRCVRE
jgi:hypothetical protein